LEPVFESKGIISDFRVSEQSADLSNLGYSARKLHKHSAGLLAGKSEKEFLQFIFNTVKQGKSRITEFFNADSNRYFQAVVHPLKDNKVELILLDLTTERKHQLQAKRYENLFSKAEETSNTGFFQYNTSSQEIYITEGVLGIFECSPTAASTEQKSLSEYISRVHDADKEYVLSMVSEEKLSSSIDFKHRIVIRDKIKYVHICGSVFYDTLDDTISLIGTIEDITAFKKVEDQLHYQRKQLDEAEKIVHIASWKYEFLADAFTGTSEACNILGITAEDFPIPFNGFTNLIHKDDRVPLYNQFQKALTEHHDMVSTFRIVDKMGITKNIRLICWNQYTTDNKPLFSRGYLQDISEQYKMEEQLAAYHQALQSSRELLQNQQAEFDKVLEIRVNEIRQQDKYRIQNYKWNAINNILTQVAQNWLEPVHLLSTQIRNCVEAYQCGEINADIILQKHEDMKKTIDDILAKVDIFREHFDRRNQQETFSLNHALQEIVSIYEKTIKENRISLTLETEEDCQLDGKKTDFSEAVINIINNSHDIFLLHQIEMPQVVIKVKKGDKTVILEIADNGGGIPPEIIDRIFEPYFTTREAANAGGLGLFITKKIIETYFKGQLEGFNQDSGACFRITIPIEMK
jgi:signal transduction histidine kinase/PAS domain-containing protein